MQTWFAAGSIWRNAAVAAFVMVVGFCGSASAQVTTCPPGPTYDAAHDPPERVCVPLGDSAFAAAVQSFKPGSYTLNTSCPNAGYNNPPSRPANQNGTASGAIGPPDVPISDFQKPNVRRNNDASIGGGGVLVVRFNSPLTGDGNASTPDVWVWEVGLIAERYSVEVSPDNSSWTLVGQSVTTSNGSQGFDIDHSGFNQTSRLFYVRIIDLSRLDDGCQAGSDIDAVAVLSSIAPQISLIKTANPISGVRQGDTVTFTFLISNPGTDTLNSVTLTDAKLGLSAITCGQTTLAPGGTTTCTANYVVTALDVLAGIIENTATATGIPQISGVPIDATHTATVTPLPPSDLTITKTHAGSFIQGQSGNYMLTVTNVSGSPSAGTVTVTDTLPAGLTATGITGTGWTCTLATLICTRGDALAPGASFPNITLSVTVDAATPPGTLVNTSVVNGGGDSDPTNNTATDSTVIVPPSVTVDLQIAKSHSGSFTPGQSGTYSVIVSNVGGGPSNGVVTVTEAPPAGLTVTGMAGSGWTCTVASLTCTRGDVLATGAAYPTITVTVNVDINVPPGSLLNTATVSGGSDSNPDNNTATDSTPIVPAPSVDLTIDKSHSGPFVRGQSGTYSIVVVNVAFASSSGVVTVHDTLPAGMAATAIAGAGWSCVLGTLTCNRSDALPSAASYPPIEITVSVDANVAPGILTNTTTVSGGGDTNPANNDDSDPTPVVQAPVVDLTIDKIHTGAFVRGQSGTYQVVVANVGSAPSTGVITVQDTLPAGLTPTAISGPGWSCALAGLTCTRSDVLNIGAAFPPITLTVTVNADVAAGELVNSATVSGGGDSDPSNNTDEDPTLIVAAPIVDLAIEKRHSGNFVRGQSGTYTLTVTNVGTIASTGVVTVRDTVPDGLTLTAMAGTGWSCTVDTRTCTRGDTLNAGASYPPITVTVTVNANAPLGTVVNGADVSGGGDANPGNNTASDPTVIISAVPTMSTWLLLLFFGLSVAAVARKLREVRVTG